jgi:hypothetical protein
MAKEQALGKAATRRCSSEEKAAAVRIVEDGAGRAGDHAGNGAAGRDAARLRGRVRADVGEASLCRRWSRPRGEHCWGATGARARAPPASRLHASVTNVMTQNS